jgi:methylmalonyl-CoA mutase N-terminal domain/subunit
VVVGVNRYASDDGEAVDTHRVTEAAAERQLSRLEEVREERDEEAVEAALAALREAVREGENTVPYVIDAVKAYATMGEVMAVYREEHGSYRETAGAV